MTSDPDATARAYLLGELSDEGEAAIEQALLVDRDLLALVHQVEHDLVDDYVAGSLATEDRDRFEQYYLASAPHRSRVAVARALFEHGDAIERAVTAREDRESGPRAAARSDAGWLSRTAQTLGLRPVIVAWIGAVVIAAVAATWVLAPWRDTDRATLPRAADTPATPGGATTPPTEGPQPARPTTEPARIGLVLPAIITRSRTQTPRLVVPEGVAFVDLLLEGSTPRLANAAAELVTADGDVVWSGSSAPPSSSQASSPLVATVTVPAERLRPDDYILTLSDRNAQVLGRYVFRVSSAQ
jgi:hypothetical protein